MANPPITIGPFTNVPAPGSPIASAWPQQITQYVVDRDAQLQQLRLVNRQTVALTFPSGSVDTVGVFAGGNIVVPQRAFNQILIVSLMLLLTASADVDINLLGPGATLMRRARFRDTTGHTNGVSMAFTTGGLLLANTTGSNYAVRISAISGTATVAALGDSSLNYLDITAIPAPL